MNEQLAELDQLGLYVHFPWCIRKCPYCDFNSHAISTNELPEKEYLDWLIADFESELLRVEKPIRTVYFGGGTPSLFQPASFERLLSHPSLNNIAEATIEVNPGASEAYPLQDYVSAGITRISIGVQSLDEDQLKNLGRIHSVSDVYRCVEETHKAGFDSINLDLMFGLPNQTIEQAMFDLEGVITLEPQHISWYQLTIEPNTQFHKYPPNLASDDELVETIETGLTQLSKANYKRYEVSAYSQATKECQHNLNYWRFGDYIGIGAGAHGKLTQADGSILRTRKRRQPTGYMSDSSSIDQKVEPQELPVEFMLNVLRLREGVATERFTQTTGLGLETIEPKLQQLREDGLLNPNRIALTQRGYELLDSVVAQFM